MGHHRLFYVKITGMKIALLSDIHDNVWNLDKALKNPALQAAEALLFCGDLCAPFVVHLLGEGFEKPIHMVLGNNDGDVAAIIKNTSQHSQIQLHGEYYRGEIGGRTIAMNHYPEKARKLAELGIYDIVCYGHNHTLAEEKTGPTLLLNPGPIMGYHGGRREDVPATFMLIDMDNLQTEVYSV